MSSVSDSQVRAVTKSSARVAGTMPSVLKTFGRAITPAPMTARRVSLGRLRAAPRTGDAERGHRAAGGRPAAAAVASSSFLLREDGGGEHEEGGRDPFPLLLLLVLLLLIRPPHVGLFLLILLQKRVIARESSAAFHPHHSRRPPRQGNRAEGLEKLAPAPLCFVTPTFSERL